MADAKTKAAKSAFDVSIDGGITLFDTAEVYGSWVRRRCHSVLLFLSGLILKKTCGSENVIFTVHAALKWCCKL